MDKGQVIETLRRHEPELKDAGIVHLRLFGSVARGEATALSDVDLIADFDRSRRLTLFGMARLENRLSDLLGAKVDLSPAGSMKERVRGRALHEAVHAF
ncbi:MAG: nucleotidyltransferase family protein [Terracidiphilus sp.]|jgi:predicted nucleotidyltransferase